MRAPAVSTALPEKVHRAFIKFTLKMRSRTNAWVAFREAGMYPLQYTCLHRMLAFLEAVLDLDDGEYAKVAMQDCIADARIAGVDNWFHKLFSLLTYVNGGIAPADALHHDGTVDVDKCLALWRRYHHTSRCGGIWLSILHQAKTSRILHQAKTSRSQPYNAWFPGWGCGGSASFDLGESHWRPAPCITADNIPYSHLISLIKLRTNSHALSIEMLRHARPRVPRASRTCPWCHTPGALHDELHCVLECPSISETRLRYPALFGAGAGARDMRTLFGVMRLWLLPLASFVHNLLHVGQQSTLDSMALPRPIATT